MTCEASKRVADSSLVSCSRLLFPPLPPLGTFPSLSLLSLHSCVLIVCVLSPLLFTYNCLANLVNLISCWSRLFCRSRVSPSVSSLLSLSLFLSLFCLSPHSHCCLVSLVVRVSRCVVARDVLLARCVAPRRCCLVFLVTTRCFHLDPYPLLDFIHPHFIPLVSLTNQWQFTHRHRGFLIFPSNFPQRAFSDDDNACGR